MYHQFTNDYSESVHPEIWKALTDVMSEQNRGYGLDRHSQEAERRILSCFGIPMGAVFFLGGGTQTNMTVISFLLRPYEGVISCDTGHINVHETAAVEGSGHKVLCVPNRNGKIDAADVEKAVRSHADEHMVKLKMVYLSDTTETGTVYSKKELTEIRRVCDKYGLLLFLDGARLGAALTCSGSDLAPEDLGKLCDVFYVGGTKNGMLFGEAVVFSKADLAREFRYQIKNRGAMLAKGFVPGAMFERAFDKDLLYFSMARHANEMAELFVRLVEGSVEFSVRSVTNQQFLRMKKEKAEKLIRNFGCELWTDEGETQVIRVVTSFATKEEDVRSLADYIKQIGG